MMTYEIKKQVYELTKEHILEPSRFNSNDLMPVMRACGEVWLTTAGSAKADALGRAFAGASPLEIPVAGILSSSTHIYLDEAAAARIS